jgi:hypothetical protein
MGNMIYKVRDHSGTSYPLLLISLKCGGIEMPIMEQFQKRGVKTYGEVLKELKAIGETPYFYTPNNKVIINCWCTPF